jgi:AcrR family transcriptional regulator
MKTTKRELQKKQTRQLIIESAYTVFSTRGIMASRISDIAEAADVSHGTVFLHFASQEALIEEVVAYYGNLIAMQTHALSETSGSLEEQLRAHVAGLIEFEPFYAQLVLENRLLPKGARDTWVGIQSAVSFHFSRALERESGINNRGVPGYMAFNMWMGLVHYYLSNGDLFAPEGGVLRRHGEELIESFMMMLRGGVRK